MRTGENPLKNKEKKIPQKKHRVIMVFYIPDATEHIFFTNLEEVLNKSLESLINTINHNTTNITLINNASSPKINSTIKSYSSYIDKYVFYKENKGKVNAVINEARGVYEEFVTITDADILFYSGWEKETFNVFKSFPNTGAVSPHPCPYLTFYCNKSSFGYNSFLGNIEYGKYVRDSDIDLYIKGTNLPKIIDRETKYNWKEKQFVLKNKNKTAVIGSYHVVGTYRSFIFREQIDFPAIVFKNSYEEKFIDCLSDQYGLNKLSTMQSYIYHIGNNIDDVVAKHSYNKDLFLNETIFKKIKRIKKKNNITIFLNRVLGYFFIKYKWIKL